MMNFIKHITTYQDISLPLTQDNDSGSNMPWQKKRQYIPPYIDFSEIEEEEILAGGSITAEGSDMPWDAKGACTEWDDMTPEEEALQEAKDNSLFEYNSDFWYE